MEERQDGFKPAHGDVGFAPSYKRPNRQQQQARVRPDARTRHSNSRRAMRNMVRFQNRRAGLYWDGTMFVSRSSKPLSRMIQADATGQSNGKPHATTIPASGEICRNSGMPSVGDPTLPKVPMGSNCWDCGAPEVTEETAKTCDRCRKRRTMRASRRVSRRQRRHRQRVVATAESCPWTSDYLGVNCQNGYIQMRCLRE